MNTSDHRFTSLPYQPPVVVSYWNSGRLVHLSAILFTIEAILYYQLMEMAISYNSSFWSVVLGICFIFSFIHIFLVLADGWCRFQDYKRAKDQVFLYGLKNRILMQYASSQCQRSACINAAKELGYEKEAREYYRSLGYKWYHVLPDFMVKDPFFFYKKYFWKRTFLEKNYTPKYNYRKIYLEVQFNDLSTEAL